MLVGSPVWLSIADCMSCLPRGESQESGGFIQGPLVSCRLLPGEGVAAGAGGCGGVWQRAAEPCTPSTHQQLGCRCRATQLAISRTRRKQVEERRGAMDGEEQPSGEETITPAPLATEAPADATTATVDDLLLDLKLLRSGFSPTPDNHLHLDGYMDAYIEMNKFLGVLGPVFNMVTSEIKSKVSVLREHRQSEEGENYETLGSMLRYEQGQAKGGVPGERGGRPSGARTLLRLHRALEFVLEFLVLLMRPKEGFFGGQASRVYGATLGRHHGTLIRATTSTALLTLPSHATILQRLMKGKTMMGDAVRAEMEQVTSAMRAAYSLTQGLYQQYGYLDLP